MKKILVIGSLNMDLVAHVPHLPHPGETISSIKFQQSPGGKGANQAVAAAKLGGNVAMIGRVGADDHGQMLLNNLRQAGVDVTGIRQEGTTGMAFINVSKDGENHIILVPGANHKVSRADIDDSIHLIQACDFIIMQLEIPLDVVDYVLTIASEHQKEVILNPAPGQPLSTKMLGMVHTLIPNETELQQLTGMPVTTIDEIVAAALVLKTSGVARIIVTMGEKGSLLLNEELQVHIPAVKVIPVDTTAAGDAYIAAFAVGLTKGLSDSESAEFATLVSAIVVTREGAQLSLPTLEEVK
ncbi:ribokinase [Neobacillus soli]|uniref:ribokinase n=1 Tax=Neobacillus soli TaxID=220688 RepID=UPI000A8A8B10|nr:ribokinase [Neobacillus soli]